MDDESNLLPLSALQHLLFCERQCALIHIEQLWADNQFTSEGNLLHQRTHEGPDESRPGVRIARGMPVRSLALGLSGQCDVVEFHLGSALDSSWAVASAVSADKTEGAATSKTDALRTAHATTRPASRPFQEVIPVEYKRGKPKAHAADEVQLCAQALCLEEMLGLRIERGLLYYGKRRRRTEVFFDGARRELTQETARRLHALIAARRTPIAQREKKCESCSLLEICLPDALRLRRSVAGWFAAQLRDA